MHDDSRVVSGILPAMFFMPVDNFRLTILSFRVTFTPMTFCVSCDLKFSLNHNFKQLNSIAGSLILKVR